MAWPLLLPLLLQLAAGSEPCGDIRDGADKGMLRPPRPVPTSSSLNCTWTLRAAPGQRLLVRLDSVQLPPLRRAALRLSVDGRVSDITHDCVHCLDAGPAVAGRTVHVHFVSSALGGGAESEAGSFQLRYRAFDPDRCERPPPPSQGSVVGRDWRVGQQVRFACDPPLDPVGAGVARCERGDDGVPRWSSPAPRCALSDCRRGSVRREAGAGAIASPGYPERRLPANRRCQWDIRAPQGHQVWAAFTQLRLPRPAELYLFDGDESRPLANNASGPLNVTTASNRLLVVLLTAAQQLDDALLYMDYAARASCPEAPDGRGQVLLTPQQHAPAVGTRVAYRCRQGQHMRGEPGAECLPPGVWSAPPPRCVANNSQQDVVSSTEDDLGGQRGFTVAEDVAATAASDVATTEAETTEPWAAPPTTKETLTSAPEPTASEEALDPLPQSSTLDRLKVKTGHTAIEARGPVVKPSLQERHPGYSFHRLSYRPVNT
ncbi:hypothetical protein V5799_002208 [Amblyomma americanum]|uniref:Uncharacterized protein n=1 Tax=Amblyomma americanum TaxID=6943 RepID=A0AAQ4CXZ9_AMBAM